MLNKNERSAEHWFWLSNSDPYNYDVETWEPYPKEISDLIQNNFKNKITNFPINATFSIDLIQMIQYRKYEPDRCRPIRKRLVSNTPDTDKTIGILYNKRLDCIICRDSVLRDVILAPCGHNIFCFPCFENFIKRYDKDSRFCPLCKKLVESHIVISKSN
jgi:hypothetical protein